MAVLVVAAMLEALLLEVTPYQALPPTLSREGPPPGLHREWAFLPAA